MTKIKPFSNGTEAHQWIELNCDQCSYSPYCYAKKQIELGFVTGEITLKQAEWIGYVNKRLSHPCTKLDNPKPKVKKKKDDDSNNLKLF